MASLTNSTEVSHNRRELADAKHRDLHDVNERKCNLRQSVTERTRASVLDNRTHTNAQTIHQTVTETSDVDSTIRI